MSYPARAEGLVNIYIWCIDETLSGAITPGQSGPGSDGIDGVLRIPQNSSIIGDCLMSYPEHSLERVLSFCWDAIGVFYSPSWSSCLCLSMRRDLQEYITCEFVPTSPAMSRQFSIIIVFLSRPKNLLIIYRENNWIRTFPKDIFPIWNANSVVL